MGNDRGPVRFSLASLLICVACVTLGMGLSVTALHATRGRGRFAACKNNLKHLGLDWSAYVTRSGNHARTLFVLPPAGAAIRGVPGGPNGAFWNWVRRSVPAVAGGPVLSTCPIYRGRRGMTSSALDYAGPDLTRRELFPGGVLSERVSPSVYIAGDLLLPGDCNHGESLGRLWDFHGLRFDGSVATLGPDHGPSATYLDSTNAEDGVRTP